MIYEKLHTTSHGSHAEPILIRSSVPRVLRRTRLTISIYSSELQVMLPYHNLDLDVECYHLSDLTTYIMKNRTFMIDGWCSSIDRSSRHNFENVHWHCPRYAGHHLDWAWRWDCRCVIVPSVKPSELPPFLRPSRIQGSVMIADTHNLGSPVVWIRLAVHIH